jgi:hypothetical protein
MFLDIGMNFTVQTSPVIKWLITVLGNNGFTLLLSPLTVIVMQAATFLGSGLALWLAGRFLDHRPPADFGFHFNHRWWTDFG